MGGLPLILTGACAIAGVLLDRVWGEPKRGHPLVGFGRIATRVERRFNPNSPTRAEARLAAPARESKKWPLRLRGLIAWMLVVIPPVAALAWLTALLPLWAQCLANVLMLWFALGAQSLDTHIAPIARSLAMGDLDAARQHVAKIVSRDVSDADETAVAKAAVESALENGNDAIFAALFWFLVAGGPGAVAFRLLNTLDAMWGYRTPRLLHFGWAAARIDDVANYVPARLTSLIYTLLGNRREAWHCWRTQAKQWESPNAGPVMASGAGSLVVTLGGTARYHGADEHRPTLGTGPAPRAADIKRALRLVRATTWTWLLIIAMLCTWPALLIEFPPYLHDLALHRATAR